MSFMYTKSITRMKNAQLNFGTADFRLILVMTNTTADTEEDVEFIAGFTTLDEMDGLNYARPALTTEAVNEDLVNNRTEFDADNVTFTALGAGTRDIAGAIVYVHGTTDADSYPVYYLDDVFPFTANGGDLTLNFNADGIAYVRNAV